MWDGDRTEEDTRGRGQQNKTTSHNYSQVLHYTSYTGVQYLFPYSPRNPFMMKTASRDTKKENKRKCEKRHHEKQTALSIYQKSITFLIVNSYIHYICKCVYILLTNKGQRNSFERLLLPFASTNNDLASTSMGVLHDYQWTISKVPSAVRNDRNKRQSSVTERRKTTMWMTLKCCEYGRNKMDVTDISLHHQQHQEAATISYGRLCVHVLVSEH